MSYIYLILIFSLLDASVQRQQEADLAEETKRVVNFWMSQVKEEFRTFCQRGSKKHFYQGVDDLAICLKTMTDVVVRRAADPGPIRGFEDFCLDLGNEILECFSEATERWKLCMDADKRYLADFLMSALTNLEEFFCENQMAAAPKALKDSTWTCLVKMFQDARGYTACLHKYRLLMEDSLRGFVSKNKFSRQVLEVKECYEERSSEICPDQPHFRILVKGALNAATDSCRKPVYRNPLD